MKKQYKYHVYKKSLISNWTIFNSKSNKIKGYRKNEDLMLFTTENYIPIYKKSSTDHFCILYKDQDNINDLDDLEKILNKKNGPEFEIDLIANEIIKFSVPNNAEGYLKEYTNNMSVLRTLQFWRERWETIVETSFLFCREEDGNIHQIGPKHNINAHIDSQYNSLYKLGYIKENDLPKWFDKSIEIDKWINEHHEWAFNEKNSKVYVHVSGKKTIPNPLFSNPIFLAKIGSEKIFYFQISPRHTIFVLEKNSTLKSNIEKDGLFGIIYSYITMGKFFGKFYVPFLIKGENDEKFNFSNYFPLFSMIASESTLRRYSMLSFLDKNSKDKTRFIYDISLMISEARKKISNFDLTTMNEVEKYHYYYDGRESWLFMNNNEIDDYEKKINDMATRDEIIAIHLRESKKIANDKTKVTEEGAIEKLSHFDFENKYT